MRLADLDLTKGDRVRPSWLTVMRGGWERERGREREAKLDIARNESAKCVCVLNREVARFVSLSLAIMMSP